jgi:hypothetical protein
MQPDSTPLNPSGLCQCGCGQTTTISARSNRNRNMVKGQHIRFVHHHGLRINHHRRGGAKNIPADVWKYITKSDPDDCWLFTRKCNSAGYGHIICGKEQLAHRIAWISTYGAIPDALCVLHKCDNPPCCNPRHLFLGTRSENSLDMHQKGRNVILRGSKIGLAKLTERDIPTIRRLYASGDITQAEIADIYHVHGNTIGKIINGKTWTHV